MPTTTIGSTPYQIANSGTASFVVRNTGRAALYISNQASVDPNAHDMTIQPGETYTATAGRELWVVSSGLGTTIVWTFDADSVIGGAANVGQSQATRRLWSSYGGSFPTAGAGRSFLAYQSGDYEIADLQTVTISIASSVASAYGSTFRVLVDWLDQDMNVVSTDSPAFFADMIGNVTLKIKGAYMRLYLNCNNYSATSWVGNVVLTGTSILLPERYDNQTVLNASGVINVNGGSGATDRGSEFAYLGSNISEWLFDLAASATTWTMCGHIAGPTHFSFYSTATTAIATWFAVRVGAFGSTLYQLHQQSVASGTPSNGDFILPRTPVLLRIVNSGTSTTRIGLTNTYALAA